MPDVLTSLGRRQTLWAPRASQIACSEIAKFIASIGGSVVDYKSFHAWSASDLEGFWGALWDYMRIIGYRGNETVMRDPSGDPGLTVFFPKAKVNVAENILRGPDNRGAAHFMSAAGVQTSLSTGELKTQVARISDGLLLSGVESGDVVVSTLPIGSERLVAYLACLACGAVWAQLPNNADPDATAKLIGRIGGKLLFANASDPVLVSAADHLACAVAAGGQHSDHLRGAVHEWGSFGNSKSKLCYQRIGFNDPAVILFENALGTVDAITHSAGGMLITHLKEHRLHGDVKENDILLSMELDDPRLWLWQVSAMACGAETVFLDDETYDLSLLQTIAQNLQVTHLVADPTKLQMTADRPGQVAATRIPESVRVVFFAGEVLDPKLFDRIYKELGDNIMLCPMAGSSRHLAHYFAGSPLHPVRRGEYSALALGMALHVLDEGGRPIVARTGKLVCSEAFPTMPKRTPFGSHGPASGGLPIGRLAQITCYGSAMLCPGRVDEAAGLKQTSLRMNAEKNQSHVRSPGG